MAICPIPENRDEWLKLREGRIGASEASALLGIQATFHLSPHTLWAVHSGKMSRPDSTNVRTRSGQLHEDAVAHFAAEEMGWTILPGVFAVNDHVDKFSATLDRVIAASPELEKQGFIGPGALECKYIEGDQRHHWVGGEPPLYYIIQNLSQMDCANYLWGAVIGKVGSRHVIKPYLRNETVIRKIREKVDEFWEMVAFGVEPPADGFPSTEKSLRAIYPAPIPKSEIDLRGDNELPGWAIELSSVSAHRLAAEKRERELKTLIRGKLGPNETAILGNGMRVTRSIGKANAGRVAEPGEIIGAKKGPDSIDIYIPKCEEMEAA